MRLVEHRRVVEDCAQEGGEDHADRCVFGKAALSAKKEVFVADLRRGGFVLNRRLNRQNRHLDVSSLVRWSSEGLILDPERDILVRFTRYTLVKVGWSPRRHLPTNGPEHPPESKLRGRNWLQAASGGLGTNCNLPFMGSASAGDIF